MSILLLLLGVALVFLAFLDAMSTSLWIDNSAGPISTRLALLTWRGALALVGSGRHQTLSLVGPFVLSLIVILWVVMLWLGWTLIFSGGEKSILQSSTNEPADWSARIYFVGYLLFTAGLGDYVPNGGIWQFLAILTNLTGLLVATLAITYILSIISAVVQKRAFASQVDSLGRSATEIVENAWNGRNLRDLDLPLSALGTHLAQVSEKYRAYPVLQYYHPARPDRSPVVAVARLDDALTLIRFGIPAEHRPSRAVLRSARASVQSFVDAVPPAFVHAAPEAPPAPDLAAVAEMDIPTLSHADYAGDVRDMSQRRKRILGMVRNNGWTWDDTGS